MGFLVVLSEALPKRAPTFSWASRGGHTRPMHLSALALFSFEVDVTEIPVSLSSTMMASMRLQTDVKVNLSKYWASASVSFLLKHRHRRCRSDKKKGPIAFQSSLLLLYFNRLLSIDLIKTTLPFPEVTADRDESRVTYFSRLRWAWSSCSTFAILCEKQLLLLRSPIK